ncbi:MAG: ABC transporter permease [Thermoproteales archaeon]|nr:ABC transporter permease [Thermoproteales archaeon]
MSSAGMEYSLKGILREVLSYKSGLFGILLLIFLVVLSIVTIIAIPYNTAINLWRGEEGIWLENPKNAQPVWVKYIVGKNLPENIVLDSKKAGMIGITKALTEIPGTDFKKVYMEFTFTYDYDDFPSEVNIFFDAKYTKNAPILKIYIIKPGGIKVDLINYILRKPDDILYLSINPIVSQNLLIHASSVVGKQLEEELPIEMALFAVEDESLANVGTLKVLKGVYKIVIEGTLFGKESDVDAKVVIYGKVWGWAGTDHMRRDLGIALLWGTPVAMSFGLTASLMITILHLSIATISGYYGGWVDSLIQRLTEIYMIIPFLPFLIMIATFYKLDIWILLAVIIVLSIFGGGIKSTRALVMQIREYPYIEAAKVYGASNLRIIFLYIIPKILPPVIPGLIGAVPGYVFLEAGLSFLGLGDPYLPTWGKVINDAYNNGALYKGYYYWVLEPAFMLILTAFAFSFLGFALDKIVNPKLREV